MTTPKRFRAPLALTWMASIAAVVLAVAPILAPRTYDGTLSVLTATLVAIIWYTYYSYRALHREPPAWLRTDIQYSSERRRVLRPLVHNPTRRSLNVRVRLEVWIDGHPLPMDSFYQGLDTVTLGPRQWFRGAIPIPVTGTVTDGNLVQNEKEMVARLVVSWMDDLGESGTTHPVHVHVNLWLNAEPSAVIAPAEMARHFGTFAALEPPAPPERPVLR